MGPAVGGRMESQVQPLALWAIAFGVVMVIGVSVTLVRTRRHLKPGPAGMNRWQRHGTIPLAAAGLGLGVISRGSGQSPATHGIIYAETIALLLAGLLCALVGAAVATRQRPGVDRA
jgi:hypothetical protein